MKARKGAVTFQGTPFTLLGEALKPGMEAPDFQAVDSRMAPTRLSAFRNKIRIIASVPSLDTAVCDAEARRFNKAAAELGENVVILTVSMDLPFALDRWCGASHAHDIYTLSDHHHAEFGKQYGVLIKELRLLSRAVFVVDPKGVLRYVDYIKEMTEQPNYQEVIEAVRTIVS